MINKNYTNPLIILFLSTLLAFGQKKQNEIKKDKIAANWESMTDNYHVPEWFQDGKFGVWFHYGIPSSIDENRPNDGSHYGRRMYGAIDGEKEGQLKMTETLTEWHVKEYGELSEFGYEDFIPKFKAENFDANKLTAYIKSIGAKFIMPVGTHHDNFDMYDSFFEWNSVKMGPKRDFLKEWKLAAEKHDLKFGVSTHLYWSPRFFATARKYQKKGTPEWDFFNMDYHPKEFAKQDSWNQFWYQRCWDIIQKYDPDMFNIDSSYPKEKGKDESGLGLELFANFINKNLEKNSGKQDVVLSLKVGPTNKAAFTYNLERGGAATIKPNPWMWATDLSGNWFYRKNAINRMTVPVMIANGVDAISKNGVVMLNVALTSDGVIPEKQKKYLSAFKDLFDVNGEGLYGTRPWKIYGEGPLKIKEGRQGENHKEFSQKDIRFTTKDGNLYAFVLATPTEDIIIKTLKKGGKLDKQIKKISLLGSNETIYWEQNTNELKITCPKQMPNQPIIAFKLLLK
ncbi:alpha-L-fucosidase [Wenyingzhuangia sp. 2_MG-2023]|uniref:alpha-L-fucosidase n=1 Tax=Wenyingzhuangia sp. 2_MG-2023 TaxID=3062639 RepID=UPI0026E31A36|nr:alpha-L-fucosidase [Wenyingzhuangia sp. 2_MG-2023]MDO6736279.1 alpha-L-fucosidase [Wenyingzhuangia sp. 2_MG-2023]MDO6801418.1 alpha-L-fucosidase [Wenyingzhuangia sp. 1_MG-2023]